MPGHVCLDTNLEGTWPHQTQLQGFIKDHTKSDVKFSFSQIILNCPHLKHKKHDMQSWLDSFSCDQEIGSSNFSNVKWNVMKSYNIQHTTCLSICTRSPCPGRILGIIGWDPSVSNSHLKSINPHTTTRPDVLSIWITGLHSCRYHVRALLFLFNSHRYVSTFSFFFFINLRYYLWIPLQWSILFLKSWTAVGYFSNSTRSTVTTFYFNLFCLIIVGCHLELHIAITFNS